MVSVCSRFATTSSTSFSSAILSSFLSFFLQVIDEKNVQRRRKELEYNEWSNVLLGWFDDSNGEIHVGASLVEKYVRYGKYVWSRMAWNAKRTTCHAKRASRSFSLTFSSASSNDRTNDCSYIIKYHDYVSHILAELILRKVHFQWTNNKTNEYYCKRITDNKVALLIDSIIFGNPSTFLFSIRLYN